MYRLGTQPLRYELIRGSHKAIRGSINLIRGSSHHLKTPRFHPVPLQSYLLHHLALRPSQLQPLRLSQLVVLRNLLDQAFLQRDLKQLHVVVVGVLHRCVVTLWFDAPWIIPR